MKLRAMLLALALAACGQAGQQAKQEDPNAPADPFELNIEIGRYGVMLSQIHSLTGDRPGTAEPQVTDPRDLAPPRDRVGIQSRTFQPLRARPSRGCCVWPSLHAGLDWRNSGYNADARGNPNPQPRCRRRGDALLERRLRRRAHARNGRASQAIRLRDRIISVSATRLRVSLPHPLARG